MKRIHLVIKGRVQGVSFRAFTKHQADKIQLRGFVRNLPNGDVEIVAEGDEIKLRHFAVMLEKGPPNASVSSVDIKWLEPKNDFDKFYIL